MADTGTPARCAACGRALPEQVGRGRVRVYCDASCRSKARRARQAGPAHVNSNLTNRAREGKLDNVPDSRSAAAGTPPLLTRVINAGRVALDDVPAPGQLAPWTPSGSSAPWPAWSRTGCAKPCSRPGRPATPGPSWAACSAPPGRRRSSGSAARLIREQECRWPRRPCPARADAPAPCWPTSPNGAGTRSAPGSTSGWPTRWMPAAWLRRGPRSSVRRRVPGHGEPVVHQAGDYTVVNVPLRFEAAELTGRVSYDRAGQVAGLYFV